MAKATQAMGQAIKVTPVKTGKYLTFSLKEEAMQLENVA